MMKCVKDKRELMYEELQNSASGEEIIMTEMRKCAVCALCPKSSSNFRDKTRNAEKNEIIHKIFRVILMYCTDICTT